MDLVVIALVCLGALAFFLWVELRVSRMEQEARAREAHPAGTFCPTCNYHVEDWETHERLAHRKRVASPDDSW